MINIPPTSLTYLIECGIKFSEGDISSYTSVDGSYKFLYQSYKNNSKVSCREADNILIDVSLHNVPKFYIDIFGDSLTIRTYDYFINKDLLNLSIDHDTIDSELFFQLSTVSDLQGLTVEQLNGLFKISRNIRSRNKNV
ncbi:hypothetical protein N0S44_000240 [Escherichia coli]|nr:hypothetical protein [Escherichia coli]EJR1979085.1 hypothetical protein [Escherichia coli]